MIDTAIAEYTTLTGIPRQRRYYHWSLRQWVQSTLIDIGRSAPLDASTAPLVDVGMSGRYMPSKADELYAYLAENGPKRPVEIEVELGIPSPTTVTITKRNPHLFVRKRTRGGRGGAVYYSARET